MCGQPTSRLLALRVCAAALIAVSSGLVPSSGALAQDDLAQRASWTTPTAEQVKVQIDAWLADQELDELTKAKLEALWPEAAALESGAMEGGDALLDQAATTIALVHEPARQLVDLCQQPRNSVPLPAFEFLDDEKTPPFVRNNMRLLYGRWLAQNDLYDESIEKLRGLEPDQVVAPGALLFYLGAGYHRMLDKDKCLPLLARLLEREQQIPVRYRTVAQLMAADLKPLKTDSLDEVARLMDDIRRRLDLGRAGTRVRKQEDDVIAKLDKMIEELEKQQKGGGGGGGGGSLNPSSPAPDSANLGGKGPGNVEQKNTGSGVDWGNLPPKERQEALQQISRDLPAHYREVIEEYFRKLARDGGN